MNLRIKKTKINDAHYRLPSLPQTNNIHAVNNFINLSRIFPPSFMTRLLLIILLQSHLTVPQISGAIPPRSLMTSSRAIAQESVREDPMYKSHLGKASFRALASQSDHEKDRTARFASRNSQQKLNLINFILGKSASTSFVIHALYLVGTPIQFEEKQGLFCGGLSDLVDQGPGAEADEIRAFGSLAHRIHEPC
ncbi:hypothetical protein PSTG_07232 [Puccinia striiformis f. sp. tritici PST-78]|uniref:Uncharacterized protein n=1 Tax=Puccinia striiformis f. sp. tritici PST-78 TaxID=1165861 RepID=A0A0L0VJR9_9BASI|nr:hypothetical protein PSTG_07232 [Puccinia striiformis f. sp. tritici PST-78]